MSARADRFSDAVSTRIEEVVAVGDVIHTITRRQPNRVVAIEESRVLVETTRSTKLDLGPQTVPAWMIEVAWSHLVRHGSLTNDHLLNTLNVKRSSFVCALLARFPDVEVVSERPVTLRYRPKQRKR
jgi:hypothetical protein